MIFNKYNKTYQFRDVVKRVSDNCKYHGVKKPVIVFNGTVKLHGTNAGIGYRLDTDFLWTQSRERVIVPGDDNAGFAAYVESHKEEFKDLLADICVMYNSVECMIYGEWAGGNIQSGVAIAGLEKALYVFKVCALSHYDIDGNGDQVKVWNKVNLDSTWSFDIDGCKDIRDYTNYAIAIDFENPSLSQNRLVELTAEVENECPVAAAHGIKGIGEGIVWTAEFKGEELLFKTKGDKHSVSKVKTVAVLSDEDLARIADAKNAVDTFATEARLAQGITKLGEMGLQVEMKNLGTYLKWVAQDIQEEDGDIIEASMLDRKELMKNVTAKAKNYFMEKYNNV